MTIRFDQIVGFGDSFVYGDELYDHNIDNYMDPRNASYRQNNCFLGLLGKHYNTPVKNYAYPGFSCQSIIWSYIWWRKNYPHEATNSLVLVGITDQSRHAFFDDNKHDRSHPWASGSRQVAGLLRNKDSENSEDKQWYQLAKMFTTLSSCESFHELVYHQTLMFFEGNAANHPALLQFHTCGTRPLDKVEYNTLIWPNWYGIPEMLTGDQLASKGHPNEAGHRHIRDLLIDEIDCVTIAQ